MFFIEKKKTIVIINRSVASCTFIHNSNTRKTRIYAKHGALIETDTFDFDTKKYLLKSKISLVF